MSLTELSPTATLLLVIGVLYLDGLAFIGSVCITWTIRSTGKQKQWKKWLTTTLVTCNFVLSIWPIFASAILIQKIQATNKIQPSAIAIVLFGVVMACEIIIVLWKCSSFFPETSAANAIVDSRK